MIENEMINNHQWNDFIDVTTFGQNWLGWKVNQSNITITLNFSRFMVQDLDRFFLFSSLVERLTVSLRFLQCGYSFLPAKEIPDSLSGFIHIFWGGKTWPLAKWAYYSFFFLPTFRFAPSPPKLGPKRLK
jgi:hypothetical protein